ncbi:NEMF [Enterospora canceri]|uniref:NEMF n=1 Tax=Enterospora canceri TaxID=1081671 RepID=A0A1Y1S806_9MICR|nr:NEMF [Enterospora canceri]
MKQKFSVLDVAACVNELKRILVGKYMANFYSKKQKVYYIRFGSKDVLAVEPGFRMHLTTLYESEINHFAKKLREHIRNYRVIDIFQYGFDRIIVFDLLKYKLVFEFYSLGNIILIDNENTIVDLQRPIEQLNYAKGKKYFWNKIELGFSKECFETTIDDFVEKAPIENGFGAQAIDRFMKKNKTTFEEIKACAEKQKELTEFIREEIEKLSWNGQVVFKKNKPDDFGPYSIIEDVTAFDRDETNCVISEKTPFKLIGIERVKCYLESKKTNALSFGSFNETAFVYYELESFIKASKISKVPKHEKIQRAQTKYIGELQTQEETIKTVVNMIEENREFFAKILRIFASVYENRMSWEAFDHFHKNEKKKGNKSAEAIKSYDLGKKSAIVECEGHVVELDLNLSLSQNIQKIYKKKKKVNEKEIKTKIAMLAVSEKMKPKREAVKTQERVQYWFEKFNYFISENNTLLIGGRNAQQNETVVSKYMDPGDLYFHCDVKGASSVVCKGTTDQNITDSTYMALVYSKSWDEQVMKDVFYVNPEQVSKSAPSGEFIPKGSFMISGKKTFAHPHRLEYGIGIVFKLRNEKELLGFTDDPCDHEIDHAMPIAGSWTTLRKYRYSARLVPGAERKQKIAQSLTQTFDKESIETPHNKAIRAIGLQEIINVLPGKCRIAKK